MDIMTFDWHSISPFDWSIAGILVFYLLRGMCVGFVRQLVAAFALVGSYALAAVYIGDILPFAKDFLVRPGVVFLGSWSGLFMLIALLFALIGHWLHKRLEVSVLGWANRFVGGILGVVRGAALLTVLYLFVATVLPSGHELFAGSRVVPWLEQGSTMLRQLIRDVRVRDDLKPKQQEEVKKTQCAPEQPRPEAQKVLPATIPDSMEAARPDTGPAPR